MAYSKRFIALLRVAIFIQASLAEDQKCYYGNGKEAPEKPCSSAEGSACCPDKWACLDNGLCYYAATNLYGRYSCTDKSWKAEGCPSNVCTYGDLSRNIGGEDIRQCKDHDNQWCCNANNQDVHCCEEWPEPRPFFDIPDGKQYAIVGSSTGSSAPNLATITYLAVGDGNSQPSKTDSPSSNPPSSNKPQSSNAPSSSDKASQSSASSPPTPVTSMQTLVTSGMEGPSTIVITEVQTPTSSPSTEEPQSSKKSNIPVIVGCAVGIPLALALIGILFWLLRKHREQKQHPYSETPDPYTNGGASPDFAGGAKLSKNPEMTTYKNENISELAGQGVGPERPISMIPGKAEMDSGAGFSQGAVPYGPNTVGIGGGNGHSSGHHTAQSSWGSAPPGYSPGMNQAAWTPAHRPTVSNGSTLSEMETSGTAPAGAGTAGAPVTEGGRYIPYRPPVSHAPQTGPSGLENVSEIPELSAVRTPPA